MPCGVLRPAVGFGDHMPDFMANWVPLPAKSVGRGADSDADDADADADSDTDADTDFESDTNSED